MLITRYAATNLSCNYFYFHKSFKGGSCCNAHAILQFGTILEMYPAANLPSIHLNSMIYIRIKW